MIRYARRSAVSPQKFTLAVTDAAGSIETTHQVIVPRKGVLELQRILGTEGTIEVAVDTNHIRAHPGATRRLEGDAKGARAADALLRVREEGNQAGGGSEAEASSGA